MMKTDFTLTHDRVYREMRKILDNVEGYTFFVTSWEDDSFHLELRTTQNEFIHRFIFRKLKNDLDELLYRKVEIDDSTQIEHLGTEVDYRRIW